MQLSPDGSLLATQAKGSLHLWDTNSFKLVKDFRMPLVTISSQYISLQKLSCCCFSSSGALFTITHSGYLEKWDVSSFQSVYFLNTNEKSVRLFYVRY